MHDLREFELCEPAPFMFYDDGYFALTDGTTVWLVVVSPEAMTVTASLPGDALDRVVRHAGLYKDIAAVAIRRGEDRDGKVWISDADVLAARAAPPSCRTRPSVGSTQSR